MNSLVGNLISGDIQLRFKSRSNSAVRRQGAVIVLMVLLLPVAVLMSAIAINLAYIELSRTELLIATDIAARAGGRDLIMTGDNKKATTRAKDLAKLNLVAGKPLRLASSDIEFGASTRSGSGRYNFVLNPKNPNALRVTAHRDSANTDGPLSLLMPSVVGKSFVDANQVAVSTQMDVDIGLVIDRSGSMAYSPTETSTDDPTPPSAGPTWSFGMPAPASSRWLDVVAAVDVFTKELTSSPGAEMLSLSTYNQSAITDVSMTSNYNSVSLAMDVYTNSFGSGSTNIGGGIAEGAAALTLSPLQRSSAAKVLIVMTDGIHNTGLDPIVAAQAAADEGIMIFTVTFAIEADQTRMQQVATIGSGRHYHATTSAELSTVFKDIAAALPTLLTE